jgi:hypothetical protein
MECAFVLTHLVDIVSNPNVGGVRIAQALARRDRARIGHLDW